MCVPGLPTAWTAGSPGRAGADAPRPADAERTPVSCHGGHPGRPGCPPPRRRVSLEHLRSGGSVVVRVWLVTADTAARRPAHLDPWRSGRAVKHERLGLGPAQPPGAGHSRLTAGQRCAGGTTILAATLVPACRGEGRPFPRRPLPGQLGAGGRVYLSAAASPAGAGTRRSSFGVGWAIGRRRRPLARGRAGIGWYDRRGWCGQPGGAQRALGGGWHAAGRAGRGG
jgi:hypothetical protein